MDAMTDACSCQFAIISCQAPIASSSGSPLEPLISVSAGSATILMTRPQKPYDVMQRGSHNWHGPSLGAIASVANGASRAEGVGFI